MSRHGRNLKMHPIPQNMFDIYGLALPWGLSFVESMPIAGWRTVDAASWGIVTFNEQENTFGCIAMRQRVDLVWTLTLEAIGLASFDLAKRRLETQLIDGKSREPVPRNSGKRPNLYKAGKRKPSNLFEQLKTKRRAMAAWMIGYLYYALPQPDINWVPDFQGENLHTRLWELHLFACFREQGMHVAQDHPSPDFYVSKDTLALEASLIVRQVRCRASTSALMCRVRNIEIFGRKAMNLGRRSSRFFIIPWRPTHFPRGFYEKRPTGLIMGMRSSVRLFMRHRYCIRERLFNRYSMLLFLQTTCSIS